MKRVIKNILLPKGWRWVEAQECMDVRDGTHDSPKAIDSGIPLVTSKNLVNGKIDFTTCSYISKDEHDAISKRSAVCDGDILYAMIGTIGNPVVVKKVFDFSIKNVALFKFNNDSTFNRYIYHFLNSDLTKQQFTLSSRGGAQKFVSLTNIRELNIPLPPKEEQKRIAEILDVADILRQKDRQLLEHYNDLSLSLFGDMFGEALNNTKDWEVKELKDLSVKILSGNTPKGGSEVYVENGITFLRSQNVLRNKVEFDDVVYIDSDTHSKMSKSSLHNKDILMTKTGRINTVNSSLGRAAMFLGEDDSANVNGHVYLIRLQQGIINQFVLFILTTEEYKKYIRNISVGGIDKRQLNKGHLERFPIITPPSELQELFVEYLEVIEKLKIKVRLNLKNSDELFSSLLSKAFKGELTDS